MKQDAPKPKRKRGGQPGNQNARTHGRYSAVITPEEDAAVRYVNALPERSRLMIFMLLCYKYFPADVLPEIDSIRSNSVPENMERTLT